FVSMADPYLACMDATFVAENWSGSLIVRTGIDGRVTNSGVPRYRGLASRHLVVAPGQQVDDDIVALTAETTQSAIRVALAARQRVLLEDKPVKVERALVAEDGFIAQDVTLTLRERERHTIEKVVALYTSRDRAISEPGLDARDKARRVPDLPELLARHVLAWDHLWERCDLKITGHDRADVVLHLHLFHMLQTLSTHSVDLDVGIPARGLHGEAYRGHIFWDEMFVFPFLNLRMPELSQALLLYRWRRLPQARAAAREIGCRGAMFPWQSGSNGREETQTVHLNPRSGRWLPDHSHLQRHINVSIAFSTWQYYEATGDTEFLAQYGAEIIFEIAKFWSSLATYDRADDRFDLRGVMGPDEYHDAYPWRDEPGLDNNAYTNVMVVWVLIHALEAVEALPDRRRAELLDLLDISREELERWDHISRKMRLCWHDDGILSQFEGYERLEEFPWAEYVAKYGDIARLDRILEAEGDSTNRYRLSKQADVLMLNYLLSADELGGILERLGYRYDPGLVPRTVDYYLRRTSHGSTLSKVVQAWLLARRDRRQAWEYFLQALDSDVADVQGGTTREGIHLGAMAGTVDLLQRAFTGLETREGKLWLDPCLPDDLQSLAFRLHYREHHGIEVAVTHDRLVIGGRRRIQSPLLLRVGNRDYTVDPGATRMVPLHRVPHVGGP
ncbi:MAG: glycoside hydrolase family 65 protein, partial [Frankiaceae bacterium]